MPAVLLRSATLDGAVTDVLVDGGTVAALGPDLAPPAEAEVVDLDGRVLLPGLWDAHVHFDQWTLARRRLDLGPAGSAREAAALVAARLRADPPEPGTVLVGHGFRDALWPDAPHRDLLDPVTGAVPVVLVAADLHCCWLNSAAAARYGLGDHPTGLVRERDWMPIMTDVRSVPNVLLDRWAAETGRAAAARGVVGVVDYEAPWQLDVWAARIATGADALRVVASVWPEALDGPDGPAAPSPTAPCWTPARTSCSDPTRRSRRSTRGSRWRPPCTAAATTGPRGTRSRRSRCRSRWPPRRAPTARSGWGGAPTCA